MVFRYLFSFVVATNGTYAGKNCTLVAVYDNYIPYTFKLILIYVWSLQVI